MRGVSNGLHFVMDPAVVSSMYLVPEWTTRVLEDYENEDDDYKNVRVIKLLQKEGRVVVWSMCASLGVNCKGVPAQACRLVERYLAMRMRDYRNDSGRVNWEVFRISLTSRLLLIIASCIQLAAKMNCAEFEMTARTVRAQLLCQGVMHSIEEVVHSEFHVFSVLGYRVPLWTSMEIAELLAVEMGLPSNIVEGVALVMNIAEFKRDRLQQCVQWVANVSPDTSPSGKESLRTLHLAGGAVAATARHLCCPGPDPAPRIAHLTRAPLNYIRCICDSILTCLLEENSSDLHKLTTATVRYRPQKRRLSH